MKGLKELRQARADKISAMAALNDKALQEERDLTEAEQGQYDGLKGEVEGLRAQIERLEETERLQAEARTSAGTQAQGKAPAWNKMGADNERNAFNHWVRTGDTGGLSHMVGDTPQGRGVTFDLAEHRAVTNSSMNIGTAADGGNLNPTGFVPRIAERMSEMMLADRLAVQRIQGTASAIDFPTQAADPQVFATTAEQSDAHDVSWERDALQFGKTTFTLVWKTKVLELTLQLLQNNAVDLDGHIASMIGQSVALTHNAALVAEVVGQGSVLKTFASATAIAAGEPEDIVYNNTLSYYLEGDSNVAWVMRPPTFGDITSLTGNARLYAETPAGSFNRTVMGYPVYFSGSVAAIAASAKPVLFGNWNYVGLYESPQITLLRDPYSVAGMVLLKYHFAFDYGTLQSGAIGYGVHPSA
jgi:HK97 family phage major capsid protein